LITFNVSGNQDQVYAYPTGVNTALKQFLLISYYSVVVWPEGWSNQSTM